LATDAPLLDQDIALTPAGKRANQVTPSIGLAVMLEYATMREGAEKLPLLLAAFPAHEQWETLIPAVFGQSLAEFEKGRSIFLTEHYGIKTK
jgi:hypothetical protein